MYDNDGDLTLLEIGTMYMAFRDEPEAAVIMARGLDRFLSEKEATYAQVHGHKPAMIDRDTFAELHAQDNSEEEEDEDSDEEEEGDSGDEEDEDREEIVHEFFGTPLRGGNYGRDRLWEGTLNRNRGRIIGDDPKEDKGDGASPSGQDKL